MGGKHHVLGGERAILDRPIGRLAGGDHHQDRRPVEDVELRVVQHVAEGMRGRAERSPQ